MLTRGLPLAKLTRLVLLVDIFHLEPRVRAALSDASFEAIFALRGQAVRDVPGRLTQRIELNGAFYYIKAHQGVGWAEIFKELLSLRLPIVGAMNEKHALDCLHENNIATMTVAAYGQRGLSPASLQSFIITDSLEGTITLEDVCAKWQEHPPSIATKRALIKALAITAKGMHGAGINHRDFYLCHFQLDPAWLDSDASTAPELFLMDLHRAQCRRTTPRRWLVKDIAALYFSAADLQMTQRDWLRFVREYSDVSLRDALTRDKQLWDDVQQRARKFYMRDWNKAMPEHFNQA